VRTKAQHACQAGLIVLITGWVFWPAIHGGWVWDDFAEIVRNPVLRDPAGIRKIWLAPTAADYFPLKTAAQWVEWHLWADQVVNYHLVNLGLHLLSALLLWAVLQKILANGSTAHPERNRRVDGEGPFDAAQGRQGDPCGFAAWVGGLLFAIHPLTVESVAWISEFKNTLSLPFLLLAMIAWIAYDSKAEPPEFWPQKGAKSAKNTNADDSARPIGAMERQSQPRTSLRLFAANQIGSYLLSLTLFVLAMLTKTSVVMFPGVILLYCWWKHGRIGRRDLLASAPFFAVSLILGLVTVVFQQQRAIEGVDLATGGLWSRCAGAGLAVVFYFWKCVIPTGLMPHYPLWHLNPPTALDFWPWAVMAVVFLVFLRWGGASLRRPFGSEEQETRTIDPMASQGRAAPPQAVKAAIFGLGFFLLNLLPVIGFIPMAYLRISWVADHFAYVPLIGLVGLAAAAISKFEFRSSKFGSFVIAALLAALAITSHRYARIFSGDEAFWTYALERNPDSWTAHNDLGLDLAQRGRLTEAIAQYGAAIRIRPEDAAAHMNLGNVLVRSDRIPEAVAAYEEALRLEPRNAGARTDLGNALAQSGQYSAAIDQYEQVMRLKPDFADARYGLAYARYKLGNALGNAGRFPAAIAQYTEAIRLRPDYAEARANLGLAFANTGRSPEAVLQLEEAVRLKPSYEEAHAYLGFALAAAGRLPEAIAQYEKALELGPNDSDVHYNLAVALRQAGRAEEANAHFEAAARLSAGH